MSITIVAATWYAVMIAGAWEITAEPAAAQAVPALTAQRGTAKFYASSNLVDFTGTTASVSAHVDAAANLAQAHGGFSLPVATLKTGNDSRDHHMLEALDADANPTITFEFTSVLVKETRGDTLTTEMPGTLTIHGVAKPTTVAATMIRQGAGYHVLAYAPLKLADFQIVKNLSKALGALKVKQDVTVSVDLEMMPVTK